MKQERNSRVRCSAWLADMNIQIETITAANGGKMDVIRDVEKIRSVVDAAEALAARLRLWRVSDGNMLCEGDADALKEWDALSANDPSSATRPTRALDCNRDAMAGFAAAHG